MSTETNNTPAAESQSLDSFSADFFGQKSDTPSESSNDQEPVEGEQEETVDTDDAPDDDVTQANEDVDSLDEEDDEPEVPVEGKKKKNRFQERIDDLVGKAHTAERRAEDLEAKLAEVLRKLDEGNKQPEPTIPEKKTEGTGAPDPAATNEDGTDKYPLGEYDPTYIRDLTRFTVAEERAAYEAEQARKTEERKAQEAQAVAVQEWEKKLEPARERYPDFQEKAADLVASYSNLSNEYGSFISQTIMGMDKGTDVLYYLASNPTEAKKIIDGGPIKMAVALGRIEAMFEDDGESVEETPRKKVSSAPIPPPVRTKGSGTVKQLDLSNLDDFEKAFFKK